MSQVKWGDFVRQAVGTVELIEVSLEERNQLSANIQSYATYANARVSVTLVNGFNMKHEPVYILRAEVTKQGVPKKLGRRRKPSSEKSNEEE